MRWFNPDVLNFNTIQYNASFRFFEKLSLKNYQALLKVQICFSLFFILYAYVFRK
jgi:hypothetical protein